jgi:hypothetical protein
MMEDDGSFPWPQNGNRLFGVDEEWWYNACLNWAGTKGAWQLYADGYRMGAEVLATHAVETRSDLDVLIYPIIFLYRQYLELRLKRLIQDAQHFLDRPVDFPKQHGLAALWAVLAPLLVEIAAKTDQGIPNEETDTISAIITEFESMDPGSSAFRYPVDKRGQVSLPNDATHVSVRTLADTMGRVANWFESFTLMLSAYQDIKDQIDRGWI